MGLLSLLPAWALRALRRFMLRQGRRMGVQQMLARSKKGAVRAVVRAAQSSAAYQTILREHGADLHALSSATGWAALPVLTKAHTFGRFPLAALSRAMPAGDIADVLTSSGRGGRSFGFRLTARPQHEAGWFDIDLGLQDAFGVDDTPTLLVNCLPMGVVFRSHAVAVANVSVRADMACSILRDVGPQFGQTIVCTDPLFIRALLTEAQAAGVDWSALNTSFIFGEEVLVEAQRDYIAARTGIDLDNHPSRWVGSSFGVGELGLNLLFETRETIKMRRTLRAQPPLAALLGCHEGASAVPSVFCYNPLRCFVEVLNPNADGFGELCITMLDAAAVIPLPRFATGDVGRCFSPTEVAQLAELAKTPMPWLPVVAVRGRIQDRPAGMPSVECVKEWLYQDHAIADQLTGAFRLSQGSNGRTRLVVQTLSEASAKSAELCAQLGALCQQNERFFVDLELLGPEAFPGRPVLDFERKFMYVSQDAS